MTELELFKSVGLPGWFIIIGAIVVILDRVGLFKWGFAHIAHKREFERGQAEADSAARQSEQVAVWGQMTQLQTMALQQNELLLEYIIDVSKNWHKQHDQKLAEVVERQVSLIYEIKQLNTKFTLMVGLIESDYGKRKAIDDG
jgi:hypothetical protein